MGMSVHATRVGSIWIKVIRAGEIPVGKEAAVDDALVAVRLERATGSTAGRKPFWLGTSACCDGLLLDRTRVVPSNPIERRHRMFSVSA